MSKIAGDKLRKVTLNLFEADAKWFEYEYGPGWSTKMRDVVHDHVKFHKKRLALPIQRFGTGEFDE